jgi:hypothetical protein
MTATNGFAMDLSGLTASHPGSGRNARFLVVLCFVVASAILAVSLLDQTGSSALTLFTAMPR